MPDNINDYRFYLKGVEDIDGSGTNEGSMNCKETQRCMRQFLEDELDADTAREFIMHVRSCKECMDELTIEYLISGGMQELENTDDIDVQMELEKRLVVANQMKAHRSQLKAGLFVVAMMAACVFFM